MCWRVSIEYKVKNRKIGFSQGNDGWGSILGDSEIILDPSELDALLGK